MTIKTADGNFENVAGSGTANTGLGLGIAGTALGLLNGGLGLFGNSSVGKNNNMANCNDPGSAFVTKNELDLIQQLQAKDIQLASKDSQLALKESEAYTDKKMVEVYEALKVSENQLREEVRQNKDAQQAINAQQMAWNASTGVTMATLGQQIAQVQSIVTSVVPANKVCDTGCCCNN